MGATHQPGWDYPLMKYSIRILRQRRGWLLTSQKAVLFLTIRYFRWLSLDFHLDRGRRSEYRIHWSVTPCIWMLKVFCVRNGCSANASAMDCSGLPDCFHELVSITFITSDCEGSSTRVKSGRPSPRPSLKSQFKKSERLEISNHICLRLSSVKSRKIKITWICHVRAWVIVHDRQHIFRILFMEQHSCHMQWSIINVRHVPRTFAIVSSTVVLKLQRPL